MANGRDGVRAALILFDRHVADVPPAVRLDHVGQKHAARVVSNLVTAPPTARRRQRVRQPRRQPRLGPSVSCGGPGTGASGGAPALAAWHQRHSYQRHRHQRRRHQRHRHRAARARMPAHGRADGDGAVEHAVAEVVGVVESAVVGVVGLTAGLSSAVAGAVERAVAGAVERCRRGCRARCRRGRRGAAGPCPASSIVVSQAPFGVGNTHWARDATRVRLL